MAKITQICGVGVWVSVSLSLRAILPSIPHSPATVPSFRPFRPLLDQDLMMGPPSVEMLIWKPAAVCSTSAVPGGTAAGRLGEMM